MIITDIEHCSSRAKSDGIDRNIEPRKHDNEERTKAPRLLD